MNRRSTKLIRERDYVAEIDIELSDDPRDWEPCLSLEDARKLDQVRSALREGDVAAAQRLARIYRLTPVRATA